MKDTLKQLADLHDENIELKNEIERLKKDIETQRLRANSYRLKGYKLSDELRKLKNEPDIPDIKIVKSQIEGLKAEREWISVKDRLPDNGVYVIVRFKDGCIGIDYLASFYKGVTHWMPLPEPPKQ